ncbi:MAG: hypothetical protein KKF89_02240 [Nanoarchaeota archaeon]|nr:hypothetical protein [Nanoarchaeota archaeon]MBU1854514.1 hypothetical protein [Nanoarchaeota archaeon]
MNRETTSYISEKIFDESGNLRVVLRNPFSNGFKTINIEKKDSRFSQIEKLPLETLINFEDDNVGIISESRIAERTGLGNFQSGSIRDYIDRDDQTNRHLLLRDPLYVSIQNIRTNFIINITSYLTNQGFSWITPSIFTKATEACEDISGLFWTDYQNETTNVHEDLALAQTAQLHLEAMNASFGNVFSLAPSFRNEKGEPTIKHLLEYWHLEAEIIDTPLPELMNFLEGMIKNVFKQTLSDSNGEITILKNSEVGFNDSYIESIIGEYDQITYDEAINTLRQTKFISKNTGNIIEWGEDLDSMAETVIADKKPVFVYNWPDKLKAFYFTRFEDRGRTLAKSVDLIGHRNVWSFTWRSSWRWRKRTQI